eukprot:199026-Pleurochrysis_carterae.AAC.3
MVCVAVRRRLWICLRRFLARGGAGVSQRAHVRRIVARRGGEGGREPEAAAARAPAVSVSVSVGAGVGVGVGIDVGCAFSALALAVSARAFVASGLAAYAARVFVFGNASSASVSSWERRAVPSSERLAERAEAAERTETAAARTEASGDDARVLIILRRETTDLRGVKTEFGGADRLEGGLAPRRERRGTGLSCGCLLYTSDAADDTPC